MSDTLTIVYTGAYDKIELEGVGYIDRGVPMAVPYALAERLLDERKEDFIIAAAQPAAPAEGGPEA